MSNRSYDKEALRKRKYKCALADYLDALDVFQHYVSAEVKELCTTKLISESTSAKCAAARKTLNRCSETLDRCLMSFPKKRL
jgi:hypothetical protein